MSIGRTNGSEGHDEGPLSLASPIPRRTFLTQTLGWITAGIASIIGIPVGTALVWPATLKSAGDWNPVARIGKPGPGEPDLSVIGKPIVTHFRSLVRDAYLAAEPRDVPIIVFNHGQDKFTIFDVRCTHLGCPIAPDEKVKRIKCPCHTGVFDYDGRVISGPPSRPLDRYESKIEGGVLYVGKLYRVDASLRRA